MGAIGLLRLVVLLACIALCMHAFGGDEMPGPQTPCLFENLNWEVSVVISNRHGWAACLSSFSPPPMALRGQAMWSYYLLPLTSSIPPHFLTESYLHTTNGGWPNRPTHPCPCCCNTDSPLSNRQNLSIFYPNLVYNMRSMSQATISHKRTRVNKFTLSRVSIAARASATTRIVPIAAHGPTYNIPIATITQQVPLLATEPGFKNTLQALRISVTAGHLILPEKEEPTFAQRVFLTVNVSSQSFTTLGTGNSPPDTLRITGLPIHWPATDINRARAEKLVRSYCTQAQVDPSLIAMRTEETSEGPVITDVKITVPAPASYLDLYALVARLGAVISPNAPYATIVPGNSFIDVLNDNKIRSIVVQAGALEGDALRDLACHITHVNAAQLALCSDNRLDHIIELLGCLASVPTSILRDRLIQTATTSRDLLMSLDSLDADALAKEGHALSLGVEDIKLPVDMNMDPDHDDLNEMEEARLVALAALETFLARKTQCDASFNYLLCCFDAFLLQDPAQTPYWPMSYAAVQATQMGVGLIPSLANVRECIDIGDSRLHKSLLRFVDEAMATTFKHCLPLRVDFDDFSGEMVPSIVPPYGIVFNLDNRQACQNADVIFNIVTHADQRVKALSASTLGSYGRLLPIVQSGRPEDTQEPSQSHLLTGLLVSNPYGDTVPLHSVKREDLHSYLCIDKIGTVIPGPADLTSFNTPYLVLRLGGPADVAACLLTRGFPHNGGYFLEPLQSPLPRDLGPLTVKSKVARLIFQMCPSTFPPNASAIALYISKGQDAQGRPIPHPPSLADAARASVAYMFDGARFTTLLTRPVVTAHAVLTIDDLDFDDDFDADKFCSHVAPTAAVSHKDPSQDDTIDALAALFETPINRHASKRSNAGPSPVWPSLHLTLDILSLYTHLLTHSLLLLLGLQAVTVLVGWTWQQGLDALSPLLWPHRSLFKTDNALPTYHVTNLAPTLAPSPILSLCAPQLGHASVPSLLHNLSPTPCTATSWHELMLLKREKADMTRYDLLALISASPRPARPTPYVRQAVRCSAQNRVDPTRHRSRAPHRSSPAPLPQHRPSPYRHSPPHSNARNCPRFHCARLSRRRAHVMSRFCSHTHNDFNDLSHSPPTGWRTEYRSLFQDFLLHRLRSTLPPPPCPLIAPSRGSPPTGSPNPHSPHHPHHFTPPTTLNLADPPLDNIYFECQFRQFCTLHSYNMLVQAPHLQPSSFLSWAHSFRARPLSNLLETQVHPLFTENGIPQDPLFALFLFETQGISILSLNLKIHTIQNLTLKHLDDLLLTLPPLAPRGFILHSDESSISHSSTLLFAHSHWIWLDSADTRRLDLRDPQNLQKLQLVAQSLHYLAPSTGLENIPAIQTFTRIIARHGHAPNDLLPLPTHPHHHSNRLRTRSPSQIPISATRPLSLSLLQTNIQNIRPNALDFSSLVTQHGPLIVFTSETHLCSRTKAPFTLARDLPDYTLFFSSTPRTQSSRSFHTASRAAPGGVLLGLHKSISNHPQTRRIMAIDPALEGYCIHVVAPMAASHTLHIFSLYLPPGTLGASKANLFYDYLDSKVLSLNTNPSKPTHHVILGCDHNRHITRDDLHLRQLLDLHKSLDPQGRTHYPHVASHQTSSIDTIILSQSVLSISGTSISSLWCRALTCTDIASDHAPVLAILPPHILPLLQSPPCALIPPQPVPKPPPQRRLVHPIHKSLLDSTAQCLTSTLTTRSDILLSESNSLVSSILAVLNLNKTQSHPSLPWDKCKELVDQHLSCTDNISPTMLCTEIVTLLQEGFTDMCTICPTHPLTVTHRHYSRRREKQDLLALLQKRKILNHAQALVRRLASPHFLDPVTLTLHGLTNTFARFNDLSLPAALNLSFSDHPSFSSYIDPLSIAPPMPLIQTSNWTPWLYSCLATRREINRKIRTKQRPLTAEKIKAKRISRLYSMSQKRAHRQIFRTSEVAPGVNAVFDTSSKTTITDPATVISHVHNHYANEFSATHEHPPAGSSYPFDPLTCPAELDPFRLETHAHHHNSPNPSLVPQVLRRSVFDRTLRRLNNDKAPGPDGIPNSLLKILPEPLKAAIHNLFIVLYLTGSTPVAWTRSDTILLHKRGEPTHLANKRPIGLHSSIYKLWTGFIETILSDYAEDPLHRIFGRAQEGFRRRKSCSRQLQRLIHTLEDARGFQQNIYLLYVDLSNAFNTIRHDLLFQIMGDLGFPADAVAVVKGIYSDVTTRIILDDRSNLSTPPIPVKRGTIQGDRLSPLMFLIYIEPLLRWLAVGNHGYNPACIGSPGPCEASQNARAIADDILTSCRSVSDLKTQFEKIKRYCRWGGLALNPTKSAVTGALHADIASGLSSAGPHDTTLMNRLHKQFYDEESKQYVPALKPHESYPYLGIQFCANLDFKPHLQHLIDTILVKGQQLLDSGLNARQCMQVIKRVIKPKIIYSLSIAPFSEIDIELLDTHLARLTRTCLSLSHTFPKNVLLCPTSRHGVGLDSLMADYANSCSQAISRALRDTSDLGLLTNAMLRLQLSAYGNLPFPVRSLELTGNRLHRSFFSHPLCLRQLSIMHHAHTHLHLTDDTLPLDPQNILRLEGNALLQACTSLLAASATNPTPMPDNSKLTRLLAPLWTLGLSSLDQLREGHTHRLITSSSLAFIFKDLFSLNDVLKARTALNQLSILLSTSLADPLFEALAHRGYGDLLPHDRTIHNNHNIAHLPQPMTAPSPLSLIASARSILIDLNAPERHDSSPTPWMDLLNDVTPPTTPPTPRRERRPLPPVPVLTNLQTQGLWEPILPSPVLFSQTSLFDKHVTITRTPVDPDHDLLKPLDGQYVLQYLPQDTNRTGVYRDSGAFIGSVPNDRLSWLKKQHELSVTLFPSLSLGSFQHDLAALLDFYSSSRPAAPDQSYWSLPSTTLLELSLSHALTHRLSTPLLAPLDSYAYYSARPADQLFGSSGHPHSTTWTGTSLVQCPLNDETVSHTIRWAIASTLSPEPTTILLLIPSLRKRAYTAFLQHPYVSLHPPLPQDKANLVPPSNCPHITTAYKPPLDLYVISNATSTTPHSTNFYTPSSRLDKTPFARTPSLPPRPLSSLLSTSTIGRTSYPLKWSTVPAYYTDGSRTIDPNTLMAKTGAGVYSTRTLSNSTVDPAGGNTSNTVNRAELAGIWGSLEIDKHLPAPVNHTIFTDSLCSLHLMDSIIHRPLDLDEHAHQPLLLHLRNQLLHRSTSGLDTHLQKVKAHSGIHGNDRADEAATYASTLPPGSHTLSAFHIEQEHHAKLPAWPCITSCDGSSTHLVPNLTHSVRDHALTLSHITDGVVSDSPEEAKIYKRLQSSLSLHLAAESNHFWHSSAISFSAIRNTLKARTNTLWTGCHAHRTRQSYRTAAGAHRSKFCHLCFKLGHRLDDTTGHLLGACKHPAMAAIITKRHNQALCKLQRCIALHSPLNAFYTIMDATALGSLPPGVASTGIAKWILPNVLDHIRHRLRPDLLIFANLSPMQCPSNTASPVSPTHLASLQQGVSVHVIELGYTSHHKLTQQRKLRQHTKLVSLLIEAGWTVSPAHTAFRQQAPLPPITPGSNRYVSATPAPAAYRSRQLWNPATGTASPAPLVRAGLRLRIHLPDPNAALANRVHIILLGTEGYLFRPIDIILSSTLLIPFVPLHALLRTLNRHAIQYLHGLARCRRSLDFSASDACLPPPHRYHEPP